MSIKNLIHFLLGIYLSIFTWWFSQYMYEPVMDNYIFGLVWSAVSFVFGVITLYYLFKCKISAFVYSKQIGYRLISVGLTLWNLGNLIWVYYNLAHSVAIPLPSYADLFYSLSYPLTLLGVYYCYVRSTYMLSVNILSSVIKSLLSIYLVFLVVFFTVSKWIPADVLLPVYYVIADIIILGLIISALIKKTLARKLNLVGGDFLLILAYILWFFADLGFLKSIINSNYFNGNLVDLGFLTSIFFVILGLFQCIVSYYPPYGAPQGSFNSMYLIQLPYFRQISLNMIKKRFRFILVFIAIFTKFMYK